ncbi:putative protein serine/threonine kinase [Tieghemostelium lacteum]|uniref:Protein kinase domain-containing protein n=1 Tax=Tieghemostelium lacteum TaxID=361077 RepID=A0A151ZGJ9_TIELA|nr:putative protein serine/threonine kinase [Tieghemostelium lacteum]|eukprot:KYQ93047.1 putative protein serine/threonine kinase [Tieghemostelium lacteum]
MDLASKLFQSRKPPVGYGIQFKFTKSFLLNEYVEPIITPTNPLIVQTSPKSPFKKINPNNNNLQPQSPNITSYDRAPWIIYNKLKHNQNITENLISDLLYLINRFLSEEIDNVYNSILNGQNQFQTLYNEFKDNLIKFKPLLNEPFKINEFSSHVHKFSTFIQSSFQKENSIYGNDKINLVVYRLIAYVVLHIYLIIDLIVKILEPYKHALKNDAKYKDYYNVFTNFETMATPKYNTILVVEIKDNSKFSSLVLMEDGTANLYSGSRKLHIKEYVIRQRIFGPVYDQPQQQLLFLSKEVVITISIPEEDIKSLLLIVDVLQKKRTTVMCQSCMNIYNDPITCVVCKKFFCILCCPHNNPHKFNQPICLKCHHSKTPLPLKVQHQSTKRNLNVSSYNDFVDQVRISQLGTSYKIDYHFTIEEDPFPIAIPNNEYSLMSNLVLMNYFGINAPLTINVHELSIDISEIPTLDYKDLILDKNILGQGGEASVIKVEKLREECLHHPHYKTPMVLKRMQPVDKHAFGELQRPQKEMELREKMKKFQQESKIMFDLASRYIVKVIAIVPDIRYMDTSPYVDDTSNPVEFCTSGILLELAQGSLDQSILADQINNWELILLYWLDIARALEYLQGKNICHRDLKPHNILVFDRNCFEIDGVRVKLSDFGISHTIAKVKLGLETGESGTDIYKAPEILKSSKYSTESDIFSLGLVFFEVITKQKYHNNLREKAFRSVSEFGYIHEEVCNLINQCLQLDPKKRIKIKELIDQLTTLIPISKSWTDLPSVRKNPRSLSECKSLVLDKFRKIANSYGFIMTDVDLEPIPDHNNKQV